MKSVYFETSVFLAILNGEDAGASIRALLRELKRDKTRIYTSILSVQEVSVQSFRAGNTYEDNHSKVNKLARIVTVSKEIALTCAKLEAVVKDQMSKLDLSEEERIGQNRRRKWDCFHIATAMCLGCSCAYSLDEQFLKRKEHCSIASLDFERPTLRRLELFPEDPRVMIQ